MKKQIIYLSIAAGLMTGSCTKKFDALNTDPTQADASTFNANLLLPTTTLRYASATSGYSGPILFQSMWSQIFSSALFPSYYSNGDKYVFGGSYLSYQASTWNNAFEGASKAHEMTALAKTNGAMNNLAAIGVIMETLNLQAITDVYGDIPYSQALQAKSGISQPVYDKQQDVYNGMLARLDSAVTALSTTGYKPTNDIFPYKGDIAKWKKFGNSLLLRMAMRLTKADLPTAKRYAEKAYTGGLFTSNDDNAYILFNNANGFSNANSSALVVAQDFSEVRWGKVLIDYLKTNADPRLSVIAEVPPAGKAAAASTSTAGNNTAALQQGMPNGYDMNGGSTDISKAPGYPGATGSGSDANPIGGYSRPNPAMFVRSLDAPQTILTYAQTEFLLAEAAVRGFSVGATAAVHYANGLAAALQSYAPYGAAYTLSAATATAYAAAHPLTTTTTDTQLRDINTQIWIVTGTLLDFDEAWTNWRRSGYPVLTAVNYTGNFTNGTIPRRQSYPSDEASKNPNNYKTAAAAITGGDVYNARVWWDK